jgi:tetratricopeptide (TPR) repeat protein
VKALALLLALTLAAPALGHGQSRERLTHDEALAALTGKDLEGRRQAAAWLGELGTSADLPVMMKTLRDTDEVVRTLAENSIWQVWSRSGDAKVDALFAIGVEQMSAGDAAGAIETFTRIIRAKPDFAEGWNKRATVYFLRGEYEKSLKDCDEVLKRNPQHWGVLSGYGQIYLRLGQPEQALAYFQRALQINPNLGQVEAMIEELKQVLIEKRKGTI